MVSPNTQASIPHPSPFGTSTDTAAANQSAQEFSTSVAKDASTMPWEKSGVNSSFFKAINIDPTRWDKLYPYQLMVIDTHKNNRIVNSDSDTVLYARSFPGTSSAVIAFENYRPQWIFQLPITPQQLSIADQFAISTSATLKGVVEEHSGTRFKAISASGTMGVWVRRHNQEAPTTPGALESIFGGTIAGATSVFQQAKGLVNTFSTGHPASSPITPRPSDSNGEFTSTGLYLAQTLQQFLEQYAEAKLDPTNAGWRLVFNIPKQNQSYVVTPMQFIWNQNVNRPLEVTYQFQLKAWRRITLGETPQDTDTIVKVGPGVMAQILNTIAQARKLVSASKNLVGAVRSDVEAPFTALRQTVLFVKGVVGVAISVADLPNQVANDFQSTIRDAIANLDDLSGTSNTSTTTKFKAIKAASAGNEGLPHHNVVRGQLGQSAANLQATDPTNAIFDDPSANYDLLSEVDVSSLKLSPAQQNKVSEILADARNTTVDDLKSMRAVIQGLALQLSNSFGAGDTYFSEVYNQPAPVPRIQPITLEEYDILKALYDTLSSYDILTATQDIDFLNKQTNMDYVAGLAQNSNIEFNKSISKILAPVPFGLTVEQIALRYLGDAQRWLEIVTLNNLRDPYIDENGFQRSLLSNASGRQITISSVENMYVGQRVLLKSSTQTPSARQILDIEELSPTSFLITLDGIANLDTYVTADQAYLQAYLPGTVNSQQRIFIPSSMDVPNYDNVLLPREAAQDPLSSMSKVDLLLTDDGDIAVNNFGDFRIAYGITNIMQALKLKLATVQGTLVAHPEYGAGVKVGTMTSDIEFQKLFNAINSAVANDPRFAGVSNMEITLNGPVLSINLAVLLAGQQGVFPLNFNLVA